MDDAQEWDELFEYLEENEMSDEELQAIKLEELRLMVDEAKVDPDMTIITSYRVTWAEMSGQLVVASGLTPDNWKVGDGFTEAQLDLPQSQKEAERWRTFHT